MSEELAVMEFIEEARRRLAEKRAAEAQAEMERQMEIRKQWGQRLDWVRGQLPDTLRGFVVVDPEEMEQPPSYRRLSRIRLEVPRCTPINLVLYPGGGCLIEGYRPRWAIDVQEMDDGELWLRSEAGDMTGDLYIAIATANENYPAWKNLEEEVEWRREAIRVMQERIDAQGDDEGEIGDHDEERDRIASHRGEACLARTG